MSTFKNILVIKPGNKIGRWLCVPSGITRHGQQQGWQVRFWEGGVEHSKYFSDATHGNVYLSLYKATLWLVQERGQQPHLEGWLTAAEASRQIAVAV